MSAICSLVRGALQGESIQGEPQSGFIWKLYKQKLATDYDGIMKIKWNRCRTYNDAKDFTEVIYLHEWNGKPFYWDICDTSVFGGNKREIEGKKRNPRYGSSYRHWIEGCIRHGGSLYIGHPTDLAQFSLMDIEQTLIAKYPSEMNDEKDAKIKIHEIIHEGDVPPSISGSSG